jgi:hypothetical protein
MAHRFLIADVFTDQPFTGNQLAVFPDGQGLSDRAMQAIAREFNFAETTFVLPPRDARHRPARLHRARGRRRARAGRARAARRAGTRAARDGAAGRSPRDPPFGNRSGGGPVAVRIRGRGRLVRGWRRTFLLRAARRPCGGRPRDARPGGVEKALRRSLVAAAVGLAGVLAARLAAPEGRFTWHIEQGVALGRPSRLEAIAEKRGGRVARIKVGGSTVISAEGTMEVPAGY